MCINQLKERILNDENDFITNAVMVGYLDVEKLHDFKAGVNTYKNDKEL